MCALFVSPVLIPKPSKDKNPWNAPPPNRKLPQNSILIIFFGRRGLRSQTNDIQDSGSEYALGYSVSHISDIVLVSRT
jgi:hypothetical protein